MNIEINDKHKKTILKLAKRSKTSPDALVESALIFVMLVSKLSQDKQKTVKQWVEDCIEKNK